MYRKYFVVVVFPYIISTYFFRFLCVRLLFFFTFFVFCFLILIPQITKQQSTTTQTLWICGDAVVVKNFFLSLHCHALPRQKINKKDLGRKEKIRQYDSTTVRQYDEPKPCGLCCAQTNNKVWEDLHLHMTWHGHGWGGRRRFFRSRFCAIPAPQFLKIFLIYLLFLGLGLHGDWFQWCPDIYKCLTN